MGYALRDDNRHTYADYRTWPEDVRFELINGRALLMTPAPSLDDQTLAFEIGRQVGNALEGKPCRVLLAPVDVLLNAVKAGDDDAVDTVVQPDVLVVCDPAKLARHGVRGAPDWVLEVISPASASHDQIVKLAAYEKAGVREYWIAHPTDRVLTIYRHDGAAYRRPTILEMLGETPIDVLPGVAIRWEPIVARLAPYSSN
jgi:Uma2 family endonuclease